MASVSDPFAEPQAILEYAVPGASFEVQNVTFEVLLLVARSSRIRNHLPCPFVVPSSA